MECKCTTMKEFEQIIKSRKTKNSYGAWRDIHKDTENKLHFHKFSTKLNT
jgi:hypothetical protein